MKRLGLLLFILLPALGHAQGTIRYANGAVEFNSVYWSTYWRSTHNGSTSVSCSPMPAGTMRYNSSASRSEFCDGTNWISMYKSNSGAGCSGAGTTRITAGGEMQFCNNSTWINTAVCSPGGARVGGNCWYATDSAFAENCDDECNTRGGYHSATQSYAGNTGNNAQCEAVLNALGLGSGAVTSTSCSGQGPDTGCSTSGSSRRRCTGSATTSTASASGIRRACACNQ